jgi:hypothetical protein
VKAGVSFISDIGAKLMPTKELMVPGHCERSCKMAKLRVKKEEKIWSFLYWKRQH